MSHVPMYVKLQAINKNTVADKNIAIVLRRIVSHRLALLFLNTINRENSDKAIEKIISVQSPTRENFVNKTVAR